MYLRLRQGDSFVHGAWSLGPHYKWLDVISLLWVALITVLFVFPLYKAGLPWEPDFNWELTNYTILWFAGIGLIFGGWWFLSAKNWFKGPVRMGTEEELERMEEEQLEAVRSAHRGRGVAADLVGYGEGRRRGVPHRPPTPSRRRRSGRSPDR